MLFMFVKLLDFSYYRRRDIFELGVLYPLNLVSLLSKILK